MDNSITTKSGRLASEALTLLNKAVPKNPVGPYRISDSQDGVINFPVDRLDIEEFVKTLDLVDEQKKLLKALLNQLVIYKRLDDSKLLKKGRVITKEQLKQHIQNGIREAIALNSSEQDKPRLCSETAAPILIKLGQMSRKGEIPENMKLLVKLLSEGIWKKISCSLPASELA